MFFSVAVKWLKQLNWNFGTSYIILGLLHFWDDFQICVFTDLAMAMDKSKKVKNDIPPPQKQSPVWLGLKFQF